MPMAFRMYDETTIPGIFRNSVEKYGDNVLFMNREGSSWKEMSYSAVRESVDALASYMIGDGIKPGDRIAIYSNNRPEWGISDLASLSAGAADVTIYPTNSAQEASYIINDSGSRYCLCAGQFQVDNLLKEKAGLKSLKKIIVFDDVVYSDPMVVRFKDVIAEGSGSLKESEIDSRIRNLKQDDLMTLIYTSGTTGNPKGVMLTHGNMVSNAKQFLEHHPLDFEPLVAVSILPLSHSLERTVGLNSLILKGATVAYAKGTETLIEDLQSIRPTACIYVPRVLEKIYEGVMSKLKDAPSGKKALFGWAVGVGRKSVPYICRNDRIPFPLGLKYRIAEKIIFLKLRNALGLGRIKVIGIGGAPLSDEIYEFFLAIGVEVHLGYGLTETSPITHLNTFGTIKRIKIGSCGPALPRTEHRIADDGEILIRGPQVMKGYYNRPEDTAEVLSKDGWFSTGDIGIVDADGYLKITDRKKDLIITAGGKNVAPQVIEGMFLNHPMIEQMATIGDQKKFLVALLVPSFPELQRWARENGISETDPVKLVKMPEVIKKYGEVVDELNRPLGRVEQIKRFTLLSSQFTQETGELTPTLKVKRKTVLAKYCDLIEGMYAED